MKRLLLSPCLVLCLCSSTILRPDKTRRNRTDPNRPSAALAYGSTNARCSTFLEGALGKADPARPLYPRRRLAGWRQEWLERRRHQALSRQWHLRGRDQLSLCQASRRTQDRAARQGPARGRRPRLAAHSLEVGRVEPRQETHRRHRRLGRRLLFALARLPTTTWPDPKSDAHRSRIDPGSGCVAVNGPQTLARPQGTCASGMPNYGYGAHAFGFKSFQELYDNRDKVLKGGSRNTRPSNTSARMIRRSSWSSANKRLPPVWAKNRPIPRTPRCSASKLAERSSRRRRGLIVIIRIRDASGISQSADFLIDRLKGSECSPHAPREERAQPSITRMPKTEHEYLACVSTLGTVEGVRTPARHAGFIDGCAVFLHAEREDYTSAPRSHIIPRTHTSLQDDPGDFRSNSIHVIREPGVYISWGRQGLSPRNSSGSSAITASPGKRHRKCRRVFCPKWRAVFVAICPSPSLAGRQQGLNLEQHP